MEENQDTKILWDFNIQTDKGISARRSDIVVIKKKEEEEVCQLVSWRVKSKEMEKVDKYHGFGASKVMGSESKSGTLCHWSIRDCVKRSSSLARGFD